jgi:hypothetical protein
LSSGDGLVSGRVTGIAVDPTNSSNIYVAAAGGGVWHTTNGGTSWTPLTDTQTTLAMGAIAIAPTNDLKIYAGTGEANNSGDSNHGEGILVSDNGGSTWTLETAGGAFAGVAIGQIAVDPTNADTAYAAVGGYTENGTGGNTGIWKTTDGGTTWTNVTAARGLDPQEAWTSVVVDPTSPTTIYAALGDAFNGRNDNAVYRSTDSGSTWSVLANGPLGSSNANVGRIALAVSPAAKTSGKHVLYIAVEDQSTYGLLYFLRSDNADAATPTFTNLTSGTPNFLGGQGWYDIAVNVDAAGNVYCAGVENYSAGGADNVITSSNLGVTWTDISIVGGFEPHTDSHAIAFDSSNHMFLGSDGGIFRYNPTGPSWTDLNSDLNTIQFTGIGLHPTSLDTVVGGSQDNGTELYSDSLVWNEVDGGDGGFAQIAPTDSTRCYAIHPVGSFGPADFFRRSDDGCSSWYSVSSGLTFNSDGDFYPPFVVDPTNADHVLLGMDYLNETTDGGSTWTAIGIPGTNGYDPPLLDVDSVALSPKNGTNPQVVYAVTGGTFASDSLIYVTSDDGAVWTQHNVPYCPSSCRINQIVTDPNDLTGQTALVVTNTFTGGGNHVFRTTNEGANWVDITNNLPDIPTWSVQVDTDTNKTVYISTEAGVYSSPSPYTTWAVYGTGLPNAQGVDLELNRSLHALGLATHGRGAWEILTSSGPTPAVLTSPTPGSTLPGSSATFTWTAGVGVSQYEFRLGSTGVGSNNVYNAADTRTTALTTGVISVPTNGVTLYARLYSFINGVAQYNDYTYTESGTPIAAVLTSPTPGSTLSGTSATFSWTAGGGMTKYEFRLGSTGVGSKDLYNAADKTTTALSSPLITGIPAYGATIYARIYSFTSTGASQYKDYTYTESGSPVPATLTSPTPGSTLSGSSATFSWTAGDGMIKYELRLGTTGPGSSNVYNAAGTRTTALSSPLITGIPTNGATLYARIYSFNNKGTSQYNDYTYTEQ